MFGNDLRISSYVMNPRSRPRAISCSALAFWSRTFLPDFTFTSGAAFLAAFSGRFGVTLARRLAAASRNFLAFASLETRAFAGRFLTAFLVLVLAIGNRNTRPAVVGTSIP